MRKFGNYKMLQRTQQRLTLMRAIAGFFLLCTLAACADPEFSGVYSDDLGTTRYDFRGNERVFVTVLEVTVAGDYTAHGEDIIVTTPQGTVVLARQDNLLIGPTGQVLTRITHQIDKRG